MHALRLCLTIMTLLFIKSCSQPPEFVFFNTGSSSVSVKVGSFSQSVVPTETSRPFTLVKPSEILEITDAACKYRFKVEGLASDAFGESWQRNLGKPIVRLELSSSKELLAVLIDNPSADVGIGFPLKSIDGCEPLLDTE